MQSHAFVRHIRCVITAGMAALCVSGCSTPVKLSADQLASNGVVEGANYRDAVQKLAGQGYQCFVSGAKRENFDCTKTHGFFLTCLLRIEFIVDDKNRISKVTAANRSLPSALA